MNQQMEAKRKKAKTLQKYIEVSMQGTLGKWENEIANKALMEMVDVELLFQSPRVSEEKMPMLSKAPDVEGMKILLIGEICQMGMDYLAKYFEKELSKRFANSFIELGRIERYGRKNIPLSDDVKKVLEETLVLTVGEGGMYRALNELAVLVDSGFVVDYHKVPVSQVAIEFCEFFDMDPWRLFSGNSCYLVIDSDGKTERMLKKMGTSVATIGRLHKDKKKVIRHSETESLLNRAKPDELLELLKRLQ